MQKVALMCIRPQNVMHDCNFLVKFNVMVNHELVLYTHNIIIMYSYVHTA